MLQMKTVLGRGVSGDAYSLAETPLQLALSGPAPNQLLLSLLNHSLATQVGTQLLAETLLQLALIGPAPNQHLLSLLNHSLATQVREYGCPLLSFL